MYNGITVYLFIMPKTIHTTIIIQKRVNDDNLYEQNANSNYCQNQTDYRIIYYTEVFKFVQTLCESKIIH